MGSPFHSLFSSVSALFSTCFRRSPHGSLRCIVLAFLFSVTIRSSQRLLFVLFFLFTLPNNTLCQLWFRCKVLRFRVPMDKVSAMLVTCASRARYRRSAWGIAGRLAADCVNIVDEYHSTGHVGHRCAEHCLPELPVNPALLMASQQTYARLSVES